VEQQGKSLEELVKTLPPDLKEEVRDFVEFLVERRSRRLHKKPRLEWAGALRDLRDQYTSVELQHRISEWRTEKKC